MSGCPSDGGVCDRAAVSPHRDGIARIQHQGDHQNQRRPHQVPRQTRRQWR